MLGLNQQDNRSTLMRVRSQEKSDSAVALTGICSSLRAVRRPPSNSLLFLAEIGIPVEIGVLAVPGSTSHDVDHESPTCQRASGGLPKG